jgi:hypothetical protein
MSRLRRSGAVSQAQSATIYGALTSLPSTGSAIGPTYLSCGVGPNALTSDDKSSIEKSEVYDSSATVREYIGRVESRKLARSRATSTRLVS